jgi:hypothetical protein
VATTSGLLFASKALHFEIPMGILRLFGSVYDQVYNSLGWFGIGFSSLGVVLLFVGIMIWYDRRR